jgi:hypothetical protein
LDTPVPVWDQSWSLQRKDLVRGKLLLVQSLLLLLERLNLVLEGNL